VTSPTPDSPAAASGDGAVEEPAPIALGDDERDAVAMVAEAYAAALPGERAHACRALAAAAQAGEVPAELIGILENVVALALETGKARELGRAEAERALNAVFGRTPRGRALSEGVGTVNKALVGLSGRRVHSIRAAMRLPGRYTLALELDGFSITLGLGPGGIGVEHVAAG
jgi:hypothetical protein